MNSLLRTKWLGLLAALLLTCIPQMRAQAVDDLQEYLDQLAAQQQRQPVMKSPRKGQSVEVPVGLTEVDLSQFTSYQNRTKGLTVSSSVKFINGTIYASTSYAGGDCLLMVQNGATVVLDATAGVDASPANPTNCLAAVGIYGGSTFYECGDITAPNKEQGYAIYIDDANSTFAYVSGTLTGKILNPNNGTVIGLDVVKYTKAELQQLLSTISTQWAVLKAMMDEADAQFYSLKTSYAPSSLYDYTVTAFAGQRAAYSQLQQTYNSLSQQVEALTGDDDGTLHDKLLKLQEDISYWLTKDEVDIAVITENVKAQAASDVQAKLNNMANNIDALSNVSSDCQQRVMSLDAQLGNNYFMRQSTEYYVAFQTKVYADIQGFYAILADFHQGFNSGLNNYSIATIQDIVTFYDNYTQFQRELDTVKLDCTGLEQSVKSLEDAFNQLEVNFPDEELAFTIRPTDLAQELQLGYKSNRGFVMTSAGMMWFEQVSGADFVLRDAEGNYVVATAGSTRLQAGTKEEATVWTGRHLNNGNYVFYSKALNLYLGYSGISVNNAIIASNTAYSWTIAESDLDDLQAFLNLLAEEEDTSGGGNSDLQPTDTLVYVLPYINIDFDDDYIPSTPFVFPTTPYPIHIIRPGGGDWPIPLPTPGQPRPKDYHPVYVPEGSHVIIDDVTFRDIIGGDHVFYVEGTIEINITVNINIINWTWFIHVGPGGRVIWHPTPGTGAWPRIKNEGTLDVEEGGLDYVENTGTVNHRSGTITWIVNRYIYHFIGGVINTLHNYGQHYHEGGTAITARNFTGGTFTMTGGYVNNTTVNYTDTVFVNHGTFYFRGGIIGGYGSHLVWHGPGATMRIDGGRFDFTYVKNYWIEAHSDYYIRGDYDYQPTVPTLLAPSVTIRILYNWIYKFNIVFIDGLPTPRYPLFWADGFRLGPSHFGYIGWQLPNSRWRWYVNDTDNTVEPRDEEVEDEDDLQAYLDWLAAHKDDDAASTEEQPQELDLKKVVIYIDKPVELPVGTHVIFRNGRFIPRGSWTHDRMFYIPAASTVRYENIVFDFSQTHHYIVGGVPVQRYIFDVFGIVRFGTGCQVTGFFDTSWQPTDTYIPGAVVRIDPAAHVYFDGGRFDNVVFRLNTMVNIYVSTAIANNVYVYLPATCRYEGFHLMAPTGDYKFTLAELRKISLWGSGNWGIEALRSDGHAALFDKKWMGDVNGDKKISIIDAIATINNIQKNASASFREALADMISDGKITITDVISIVNLIQNQDKE